VDACVIGVTDQSMLQRFAAASANARERQLNKLVETMPIPWESYREHVARAIHHIVVSHKPDHGHEGPMHNDTAYGLRLDGKVSVHKIIDGVRTKIEEKLNVIPFSIRHPRHGVLENGEPKAYKGYKGDSNYCIEIVCNEKGKWESEVISTFKAYQLVREFGIERLRNKELSLRGKKLVMRLIIDDTVCLKIHGTKKIVRLAYMATRGKMAFVETTEANVDKRTRSKELSYIFKTAGTLQKSNCQQVRISPIGEINHLGFKA
jgi:CRISPR-associated endonuclease Csn1